jgi:hypothetical protein
VLIAKKVCERSLEFLLDVAAGCSVKTLQGRYKEGFNPEYGLCWHMAARGLGLRHAPQMFIEYTESWPHYSGNIAYPVPPALGYIRLLKYGEGMYAKRRRSLALHWAKWIDNYMTTYGW